MKSFTRVRLLFVAAVATVVVGSVAPADAQSLPAIEGAGSSFPQLEIEQWRSDVKKEFNLRLNYVSSGSTFGRNQYMDGLVDFGVSDIPFQPDEVARAASRPYAYVPISAGGVGFMYNLKDRNGRRVGFPKSAGGTGTDLKLSPRTACRLLTESGMKWNDPEIAADNPDIALPDQTVTAVVRSDGSGTGYVVTEFCIASAPQVWAAFVAYIKSQPALAAGMGGDPFLDGKATSRWPFGWRGSVGYFAGDGVANAVASDTSGNGSITYVEAGFAEVRGFPNALVRNAANVYHYPEALHVNIALKYASRNSDGTVTLNYNTPDPEAYFPSSYSYAIAPTSIHDKFDANKGRSLATFLQYAVTRGQEKADQLGYAPLSAEMVTIALDAIDRIPGAPARPAVVTFTPKGKGGGVSGGSGTPAPTSNNGGGTGGAPAGGVPTGGGGGTGETGAGSQSGAGPAAAPGAPAGGAQSTGGNVSAPGATVAASGATSSGATPGGATATGAGATATGANTAARSSGAITNAPGGGVAARTGGGAALQTSGTSDVTRTASSPSNVDVIIAVLQGAAFCAAAAALARRFQMRSAT